MRHLLYFNAKRQRRFSDILQVCLILLTMFCTCAAVAYTYMQSTGLVSTDQGQSALAQLASVYGLAALNLVLPLAVSVLRAMIAALTPQSKYAVLMSSSIKVESEIYMYRTGKYNPRSAKKVHKKDKEGGDSNDNNQKESGPEVAFQPSKLLAAAMDSIWAEISASDITKGALISPPDYTDPLDPINKILGSNLRHQKQLTEALRPPNSNSLMRLMGGGNSNESSSISMSLSGIAKYFSISAAATKIRGNKIGLTSSHLEKRASSTKVHATSDDAPGGGEGGEGEGDVETGSQGGKDDKDKEKAGGSRGGSRAGSVVGDMMDMAEAPKEQKTTKQVAFKAAVDDGLSLLSADEYIRVSRGVCCGEVV
jgi:hypothetical protein